MRWFCRLASDSSPLRDEAKTIYSMLFSVDEFPGWVRGSTYGRPVLWRDGYLQSLPTCLSEIPDLLMPRQLSENSQRDVDSHKHMIRWPNWIRGKTRNICREVCHHQVQKRGFAIGRNPGKKVHRSSQSHGVTEVLCWSAMAGEKGTNTEPICMVTIEITTYE